MNAGTILNVNLVLPIRITKWWESSNNIIYRYKHFEDTNYQLDEENNMIMMRSGNSFSIPRDIELEINIIGMTRSLAGPMIKQQGGVMIYAGISKDFFKDKLNVSVNMDDITGLLNNLREEVSYNGFYATSYSFLNQQRVSLSLRYRFHSGKKFKSRINRSSNWQERNRIYESK